MICENKNDILDKHKLVSQDVAKKYAKKIKAEFCSVSAKFNRGIHVKIIYNY